MKIRLIEFEGCFAFECEAEDLKDGAVLVRMGANSTKEVRSVRAYASRDGAITAGVVIGKDRRADSSVPRRGSRG